MELEDLFLLDASDDLILAFGEAAIAEGIISGGRKPPMAGELYRVQRQRTEEEEERLRLLKLLNDANSAKSLKRWQEAENENARQKHISLLMGRFERERDQKKVRGTPDVRAANKKIAKMDAEEERKRQRRIAEERLKNLEKARKAKKH